MHIEVVRHFTRIGNQLVDIEQVQDVIVRENGVMNIIVGPKPGTGVTVVASQDEAWKHSFFRQFYRQEDDGDSFSGVLDLPRKGYDSEVFSKDEVDSVPAVSFKKKA